MNFNALVMLWDKKCTFFIFYKSKSAQILNFVGMAALMKSLLFFMPTSNNKKYCYITSNIEKLSVVIFNASVRLCDKQCFLTFSTSPKLPQF